MQCKSRKHVLCQHFNPFALPEVHLARRETSLWPIISLCLSCVHWQLRRPRLRRCERNVETRKRWRRWRTIWKSSKKSWPRWVSTRRMSNTSLWKSSVTVYFGRPVACCFNGTFQARPCRKCLCRTCLAWKKTKCGQLNTATAKCIWVKSPRASIFCWPSKTIWRENRGIGYSIFFTSWNITFCDKTWWTGTAKRKDWKPQIAKDFGCIFPSVLHVLYESPISRYIFLNK